MTVRPTTPPTAPARWGRPGVRLPLNRGQGAALRTGYRLALITGADVVVTMDADGQHQPSELSRLVAPIVDGDADVVNGSRVLGEADPSHAAREMGIKVFAQLLSLLTWSRITDPACGYRAVRTEACAASSSARPVPQLGVHRRGVEEASAHDRGARDRGSTRLSGHVQEAAPLPLRHGVRQRPRPRLASLGRQRTTPRCGWTPAAQAPPRGAVAEAAPGPSSISE